MFSLRSTPRSGAAQRRPALPFDRVRRHARADRARASCACEGRAAVGADRSRRARRAVGRGRRSGRRSACRSSPGVEISVTWCDRDAAHRRTEDRPRRTRRCAPASSATVRAARGARTRWRRSSRTVGIPDAFEGALNYAGNPDLIGRTHFARYIVEIGRCDDVPRGLQDAILVEGKPGYVPMQWATLEDAVGWIHAAGGVAVIAHPGRYKLKRRRAARAVRAVQGAAAARRSRS